MRYRDRVLLRVPLGPHAGYSQDGMGLARALDDAGCELAVVPTIVQPPLPRQVAELLMRDIVPPFDYFLHHVQPGALGLSRGEQNCADRKIAWSMWEFSSFGELMDVPTPGAEDIKTLSERLSTYDVLVVYDEVSREAFEPYCQIPMIKCQGGYFADEWIDRPHDIPERDWEKPFKFIVVGAMTPRKDPWVALEAFRRLREKHSDLNVELHFKTTNKVLHPAIADTNPGVKIHYANWTHHQMLAFYHSAHCLLAPSWGEGKNLPALEAMTTGIPVIATEIGGHAEWMPLVEAYPVKYTLEAHQPGMYSARADVDDLMSQMEAAVFNRGEVRRRGELAALTIPAVCDWSKVIERLGDKLSEVL